jgi:hypothetical protein
MKTEKTVEELRKESSRMQTLGTAGAAISIAGAALVGLVSVPVAAVVGLGGVGVAVVSLLKKLSDDRAVAKRTGSQTEGVLAR